MSYTSGLPGETAETMVSSQVSMIENSSGVAMDTSMIMLGSIMERVPDLEISPLTNL
jgi:hypothetical protein